MEETGGDVSCYLVNIDKDYYVIKEEDLLMKLFLLGKYLIKVLFL